MPEKPLQPIHCARRSPGLRLWPAVTILLGMLGVLLGVQIGWPDTLIQYLVSIIAPLLATLAMAIWWLGFSRVSTGNRFAAAGFFLGLIAIAVAIAHPSLIPWGLSIYVLPMALALPVLWLAVAGRVFGRVTGSEFSGWRRAGAYVAAALPLLFAATVRVDGVSGSFDIALSPRWSESAEAKYLASLERGKGVPTKPGPTKPVPTGATDPTGADRGAALSAAAAAPLVLREGDWPGFRGPHRDGVARGVRIAEEWPERGLRQVWRRRVGPGWSSFAVVDNRLFTQEQRGEEEAILCLDADTGEEIWAHTYPGRFSEMASSAGPRATPSFDDGRLYALGATGKLTALDAASGERLWQTDVAADSGAAIPEWGFSASPLVVDSRTVVVLAGEPGAKVIAYDAADGSQKWSALRGGRGYSSPHLMTICGVLQIVTLDSDGAFGLEPHSGKVLWSDRWRVTLGPRMVQPMQIGDDSVAIGTGYGMGTRRIRLERSGDEWTVREEWLSAALKPYFNDFVFHEGYLYGFDHQILTCIDAASGERQWKRGRYGFGQMLLIPDQDLLLVSGEQGQLALVRASPEKSAATELAQFQALHSKTWNHPVIVGDRLYLRNAQAAVCFDLTP